MSNNLDAIRRRIECEQEKMPKQGCCCNFRTQTNGVTGPTGPQGATGPTGPTHTLKSESIEKVL